MRHLIVGLAVALAVIVAGAIAIAQRDDSFTADARALIGPAEDANNPVLTLDTLSRGTVIATYAEIFGSDQAVQTALDSSGLTPEQQEGIEIRTRPLAGASAILVEAVAADRELAERAATAVAGSTPESGAYEDVFEVSLLQGAQGQARRNGVGDRALLALLLASALALGVAAAGVSRRLLPDTPEPAPRRR